MSDDPNFGFVIAAYGLGFIVLGGMTVLILREYWSLKRALAGFTARGPGDDPERKDPAAEGLR